MRTRRLPLWLTCTLLVPSCFDPADDDPIADGSASESNGDDGDDDDGSSGLTSASDEQGDDDPSADADDSTTSDSDGGPDTGATDDGSSTEGSAIPCEGTCVAAAPEGWNGPVTLASAEDRPASCADATYGQEIAAGYEGVVADDANCDCDCGVEEEAVCDDEGLLGRHSESDCSDLPFAIPVDVGCNDIANQDNAHYTWEPTASGGACEASSAMMVPQLGYTGQLAACGTEASASGTCEGDGECVPTPADDAALCWWSEGDVECPESLGGVRQVIYTEDPIDTRGCETCTCGEPETWCDQPGLVLIGSNSTCNYMQLDPIPPIGVAPGDCQAASDVLSVLWSVPGTPHTVCDSPSDPDPTGAVAPQGPITVCCAG